MHILLKYLRIILQMCYCLHPLILSGPYWNKHVLFHPDLDLTLVHTIVVNVYNSLLPYKITLFFFGSSNSLVTCL